MSLYIELITSLAGAIGAGVAVAVALGYLSLLLVRRKAKVSFKVPGVELEVDLSDPEKAAESILLFSSKPQVFLSYASENRDFVESLAKDLRERDIRIWLSNEAIKPGDNLRQKIEEGLKTSGYLLAIISRASIKSNWTQKEFKMALKREQEGKWPRFIPVLLENVKVPSYIGDKVYVDFRNDYKRGVQTIVETIKRSANAAGASSQV